MLKHNKSVIIRIFLSSILFIMSYFFRSDNLVFLIICLLAYLIIGYDVVLKAFKDLLTGKMFGEAFLMSIATIGAVLITKYYEAVAVMLFYQVGELFQTIAVGNSRKSIQNLMELKPNYACIMRDGEFISINPTELSIDDEIYVKPGEIIPVDCVILSGNSSIDTSKITGESMPQNIQEGSMVYSGCINIESLIKCKVISTYDNSTVSKIIDLIENASSKKSKSENFITKFSRIYTPFVVVVAILLTFIPTVLLKQDFNTWIYRSLSFLVISCPCALVISIPMSFFSGIGLASKKGILIKGSNYLETLAKVNTLFVDKTGTITKGEFALLKVIPNKISEDELLNIISACEAYSTHPIGKCFEKYNKNTLGEPKEFVNNPGLGITVVYEKVIFYVGSFQFIKGMYPTLLEVNEVGTIIYVAQKKMEIVDYLGYAIVGDLVKENVNTIFTNFKKSGITNITMLSGDKRNVCQQVASSLNIYYKSELLPNEKVEAIESYMTANPQRTVAFIGDGVNDAPVLMRADIGISMGGVGSAAAIEASDIVIMNDDLAKVNTAISISKKTRRIVYENIIFALSVKLIILFLGALGISSMWEAVFADVGVSILAILNSLRLLRARKK